MIRLDSVSKRYPNGFPAVHDLSLEVREGEVCVLVGPSGRGKTTTLKMINRLVDPTSGRIFVDGDDVTHGNPVELRRRMGYVIQQVGLFPHETIAGNVATVPRLLGWDRDRIRARTDELDRAGTGWVAVVDRDARLVGHVRRVNASGDGPVAPRVERLEAWVTIDDFLENALAAMLLTDYGWVAVVDGDTFVGSLTPDAVYRALRSSLDEAEEPALVRGGTE